MSTELLLIGLAAALLIAVSVVNGFFDRKTLREEFNKQAFKLYSDKPRSEAGYFEVKREPGLTSLRWTGNPTMDLIGRALVSLEPETAEPPKIERFGILTVKIQSEDSPAEPEAEPEEAKVKLSESIGILRLPHRIYHALRSEGIDTIGQLVAIREYDMPRLKGIGKESIATIKEVLATYGLSLKASEPAK